MVALANNMCVQVDTRYAKWTSIAGVWLVWIRENTIGIAGTAW